MRIVVLDGYAVNPGDLSWDELEAFGQLSVYDRTPADKVVERALAADAVLTNKTLLTATDMDRLPNLKYIGVLATGYNVVDVAAAVERGIVVTNIPGYSTDSVVQSTFAHILNIFNRVAHYSDANRAGRWSSSPDFCYWDTPLSELACKTLGIIGLGEIGRKVASVAHAFGMRVIAYTSKSPESLPSWIRKVSFEELLEHSDVVSLHCPLTETTSKIIDSQALSKMKRGAVLVNTARGPLVDEAAVASALSDGRLGAYGADVMCSEPPTSDNPLFSAPNAYLTPHVAWATSEARARLIGVAVSNLRAFANGEPVNVVSR